MWNIFWLKDKIGRPLFFESEAEVWKKVKAINESGKGISCDVHWAFKKLIDKIIQHQTDSKYHPLDYPVIRYLLLGESHLSCLPHLPYVFHPDFLCKVRKFWGDVRVKEFFHELDAADPASFYTRTEALYSVYKCAKYVEQIGGKVTKFHVESPKDSSSQNGGDVLFSFKEKVWHCEVKQISHTNVSLHCIANALGGMLYLKEKGKSLRKYRCTALKGNEINDNLRNKVIEFVHDQIEAALSEIEKNPRKRSICWQKDDLLIKLQPPGKRILLKSELEPERHIDIKFSFRNQQSDLPFNYYEVGPSGGGRCTTTLPDKFDDKLNGIIEKLTRQLKNITENPLGFLYLDLPNIHIDARKPSAEAQKWEQSLEDCLNKSELPLILMIGSGRLQHNIYIINHEAKKCNFICPDK